MNNKFFIESREISNNNPPYIIAEVSANHNGSIIRAKETILAAKNAGVDAVKIQTYTPDTMTIDVNNPDFYIKDGLWKGRSLYELYGEAYTPFEWHNELFSYAKDIGVTLFSSPFDETAVDLLESLNVPAYKVASFEIVDLPLIRYIAKKNKPILISTGMASIDEIANAIESAKSVGNNKIALFHCISSYPAPIDSANLNMIQILKNEFNVQVGLSDHTLGNLASVTATSLGATVIEKHFTLDRSDGGVDSSFSLEPDEMKSLVKDTRDAFSALGCCEFSRSSVEDSNKVFRRSLYFVEDVNEGDVITRESVRRIRPGFGLSAKFYDVVIGSVCLKPAKRGDRVTLEHFDKDVIK
ncbi:pseudaminic acid synthase [Vibrio sp. S4M6]|uniref:pseudaminic acid synthase n=1 Tax=Vibrio sinus TaxID=2946865 RepID=UPI002029D9C3|nr:pseudaminic acid synthase [Vibrio sinus]MCL9783987.1 pseudaminic acid synthase [Vibrio sinus]